MSVREHAYITTADIMVIHANGKGLSPVGRVGKHIDNFVETAETYSAVILLDDLPIHQSYQTFVHARLAKIWLEEFGDCRSTSMTIHILQ